MFQNLPVFEIILSVFLQIIPEFLMDPKQPAADSLDLFRQPLVDMIHPKHALMSLAAEIDWDEIENSFAAHFASRVGRPALFPRLVAGLLYLQYAYDCSDEAIINTWVENPLVQYFTGETYFQTEAPIDSSSLIQWITCIGEEGVETILMATIDAAHKIGVIKASSVYKVIVDTTVIPKAVAHPTDSRLLEKSRQHLVKLAQENGIALRHNYNREAPRVAVQVGRYAHARQFKRMSKALRHLKTRVGRVNREVERKIDQIAPALQARAKDLLQRTHRVLPQKTKDKNKLYALHAPEVECISKGKARAPYEFSE